MMTEIRPDAIEAEIIKVAQRVAEEARVGGDWTDEQTMDDSDQPPTG